MGKNVKIKYSDPQRHILGAKHVYRAQNGDDSSAGATCRRAEENKKRKEGRKEGRKEERHPNSGKLVIRPDHPRRRIKMKLCMVGGLPCVVIHVKCDPNRLGLRRCGGSKMALSYYFGQWLIQQLVLPYKP